MTRTFRLGLFVVAMLAILVLGVFLIGGQQMLFRRKYILYAQFANVAGLGNGAEVRVGGIHEGAVDQIALPDRPDGLVTVKMKVASGTRRVIKRDSVASIQAEGLVGDKYVAITFGSTGAADVKDGDFIKAEAPIQTEALVKKADRILDSLQDIGNKISKGSGTVGELVNNKDLYQKVDSTATALNEDAEALKHNFFLRGFFKKRGYEDSAELTKNEIKELPRGKAVKTFNIDAKSL